MIGIIAKKYLSEKNFNKLRELKYRLYCLSKGWTFKKNKANYEIVINNCRFIFAKHDIFAVKYIPTISNLIKPKTKYVNLTRHFYIYINNYRIKSDLYATEFDYAIKKYNLEYPLKMGDVILDVGAYHGVYSFYALDRIGPSGLIYAFEPDPKNYKILIENIKRNKIKNIIPIKKALFNKTGVQKFVISEGAGSSIYQNEHSLNGDSLENKVIITIPTISFTDFIKKYKVKNINFVKMDCEGSEIEICEDYLKNIYPKIKTNFAIASYHNRCDYKSKTAPIIEKQFIKKKSYNIITKNYHLTTYITNI